MEFARHRALLEPKGGGGVRSMDLFYCLILSGMRTLRTTHAAQIPTQAELWLHCLMIRPSYNNGEFLTQPQPHPHPPQHHPSPLVPRLSFFCFAPRKRMTYSHVFFMYQVFLHLSQEYRHCSCFGIIYSNFVKPCIKLSPYSWQWVRTLILHTKQDWFYIIPKKDLAKPLSQNPNIYFIKGIINFPRKNSWTWVWQQTWVFSSMVFTVSPIGVHTKKSAEQVYLWNAFCRT